MKFFTPELYVRFNCDDSAVADQAAEQWERAIAEYKAHLKSIRDRLPEGLREFAEKVCLHDAEYLGFAKLPMPGESPPAGIGIVWVARNETRTLLTYVLHEEPALSEPFQADVFSDARVHWLYDEVDVVDGDLFSHEILLSNGRELRLWLSDFKMFSVGARPTRGRSVALA